MKILKSSFHFQPSDDLFPTDKFRQIPEFLKITANLKRRFVIITTPDILTALGLVMRLEPIGDKMWQGNLDGNQFQIIPDIFHPMNKPGYILIRYVDADTVTLIEFDEHMMGTVGFDEFISEQKDETVEEQVSVQQPDMALEESKDPRECQIAESVGDKYVFDPEICNPSTETCGQCIHDVCCEKARASRLAARKETPMDASQPDHIKPHWACVAELTEKKLNDHEVPFEHEDYESTYRVKFELGKHKYRIEFTLRPDLSNRVFVSKFDLDAKRQVGDVIYGDEVNNPDSLSEYLKLLDSILDEEVVEELAKEQLAVEQPNKEQSDENEEPIWKKPIERIVKVLKNYRIEYKREDNGGCHYIRYETGYHEYCVYFEDRDEPAGSHHAVFSVKEIGRGEVLWSGLISSHNMLRELERAIVERIKPMEDEEC